MVTRLSLATLTVSGLLALAGQTATASDACAPGASDKPDLGFIDSNCDGIDGDKAAALFVAPSGNDNNDGSYGHPKATVAAAVTAALAAGKDVYVAAGTYDGKPAFLGSNGHIGVYGGYDAQTWQRSAANVTTLEAPGQVVGVAVPGIVLQLLTVHSLPAGGMTSYGVRAFNSDASVALSRVIVQTSNGLDGAVGANASQTPPATAPNGVQGVGLAGCDDQDPSSPFGHGGAGGSGTGLLSGGQGGDAYEGYPFPGHGGQTETGIAGNGASEYPWPGGPGAPGNDGVGGIPGYAGLNRVALFFQAEPGQPGGSGTRGTGGGGGATGYEICVPGSGGGAGGRPGVGGQGGQGGGGSIGVFAGTGSHVLVLDGSAIHTANGGRGGNGGLGQPGGAGGDGGPSGVDIFNGGKFPSGAGGHGGKGGNGGQGGGGAGGASVGVLAIDSREFVSADATITVGSGGLFGTGGHNGWQGVAQKTAQVTTSGGSTPAVGDFDSDGVNDEADTCPIVAGTVNGCPAPEQAPSGPVAGDPTATAPAGGSGSGSIASSAVSVSVLPASSCVRRAVFRIRINARKAHLRSARLTLDGHRLKLVKGRKRWTARVDLRHSARVKHTLVIRGRLRDGRRFKQTRHYLTCGATS